MSNRLISPRWGHWLVFTAVVTLILLFFWWGEGLSFLHTLEMQTLTMRQQAYAKLHQKPEDSNIVIVAYDDTSASSEVIQKLYGRNYPIPRDAMAYVIKFLKRSQVKHAYLDISFNGGVDIEAPERDQLFVDQLTDSDKFSSPLLFEAFYKEGTTFSEHSDRVQKLLRKHTVEAENLEQFPFLMQNWYPSLNPPFTQLMERSRMALFSPYGSHFQAGWFGAKDKEGTQRRWIPFTLYRDIHTGASLVYPSAVLGLGSLGQNKFSLSKEGVLSWPGGKKVHLGPTATPIVKWYGDQRGDERNNKYYPEISFSNILQAERYYTCRENPADIICQKVVIPKKPPVTPEFFKDKFVLLGIVLTNKEDAHRTIFAERYPGVYIMANQLDNFLRDDFVLPAPMWLNGLLFLFVLGFGGYYFYYFERSSAWFQFLFPVVLPGAHFAVGYGFYEHMNLWVQVALPLLMLFAMYTAGFAWRYQQAEKRRVQLRFAFGKYVSHGVMANLEKNPSALKLGGQKKELSLLFCDIRGFTSFSENNEPEMVQHFLTQYFGVMNDIIMNRYQGSINKLMGDAIMAYWGFPLETQDHAFLAVSAAMAMRDALEDWKQDKDKPPLQIGVGINTGEVLIGNVGSEDFMDFTVIGDAVNLAARLESQNKELGTTIIIAERTYEEIRDRIECRSLGEVKVKGKEHPVAIFEPIRFI